MEYIRSKKYESKELMAKIMGPNPLKLLEELMADCRIPAGSYVMDLGSGQGLTSAFLAKEYGMRVCAADLWSEPEDNRRFFAEMGLGEAQIEAVKADAMALPFEPERFDAVVSVDSYHYFGRDPAFLDEKILPFVKPGGYVYIAVPGMKKDCHDNLPEVLLRSWRPEDLDTIHDANWWRRILEPCRGAELLYVREMEGNEELWADWLRQDNPYAEGDRRAMEHGGGAYMNFVAFALHKREA